MCVPPCWSQCVCMLSGATSSGHWLLLFDGEVLSAMACACLCVLSAFLALDQIFTAWLFCLTKYCITFVKPTNLSLCLVKRFYLLLYSRWKPAATTLMSLWKCRRSWFDVELRRAGAVVPIKTRDEVTTEPGFKRKFPQDIGKKIIKVHVTQHGNTGRNQTKNTQWLCMSNRDFDHN